MNLPGVPASGVIDLGFRPREWQRRCFLAMKRFSVLVVHRRGGKTVLAVMRLIDAALRCRREAGRFAYIAPLLKQAKAIAWDYLKRYALKVPGCKVNESELSVEFGNGARVRIFGADNPDSLRGMYFDGAVLDEVAQMKPEVWLEIVLPALLDRMGWALFIGTPKGVNLFSETYYRALSDPDWFAACYTVEETDALTPADIELARRSTPEPVFRQEFMCDFTVAAMNALIGIDTVTAAAGRHLSIDQYSFAPRILGVDVARQGDDRSAIMRRQGLATWKPKVLQGGNSIQVATAVAAEIQEFQPDAVFVDGTGGYGAGVIDQLRQWGFDVTEVQFGGKALDPRFANKRAEMYWGVKEWLEAGGALYDDAALKAELCAPTYEYVREGVLQLESKDDIKARLGVSPDLADALALTFAFPVAPKPRGLSDPGMAGRVKRDYNPLDRLRQNPLAGRAGGSAGPLRW